MKIRAGFISNSSSSSFIVNPNMVGQIKDILDREYKDYYVLNDGRMVTEFIHDSADYYYTISKLLGDSIDKYYLEYSREGVGLEGDRGIDTVYLKAEDYNSQTKNTQLIQDLIALNNKEVTEILKKHKEM